MLLRFGNSSQKNVKKFLAKKHCLQQMAHSSYHEVMNLWHHLLDSAAAVNYTQ